MNDSGLLMIFDYRPYSDFADSLFEKLSPEEHKRLFYLIEEREIHKIIEEEQKKGR